MWGLGLLSWCILGAGIYLLYEWYDRGGTHDLRQVARSAPAEVAEHVKDEPEHAGDQAAIDRDVERATMPNLDNDRFPYLLGGLVLVALSFLGCWPVGMVLSRWTPQESPAAAPPAVNEAWIDRPDGSRLHIQVFGAENRPTLLLTHGWSLSRTAWDYVTGELTKRYRVVVWDLPGLGQSKGPDNRDFSIEKMANDLEAVLQATATKQPVILAGHSIGGMITQTFSRLHSRHLGTTVQGLVLVHTTYTNPLRTAWGNSVWTALESPILVPLNFLTIALAPLVWLSNWQGYLNGSLHLVTRFASFTGKQTWRQLDHGARLAAASWPAVVARGNLAMLNFNEERTLARLEIPVLVIAGEHDRMTLPQASEHIERLLPADRPYQIDGGHLGFWELPTTFGEVVTNFADMVTAGERPSETVQEQRPPTAMQEPNTSSRSPS
jgi:pimeloyl-ACP methyl ester carboxylesterase